MTKPASDSEAAAIVAAMEQFLAETARRRPPGLPAAAGNGSRSPKAYRPATSAAIVGPASSRSRA